MLKAESESSGEDRVTKLLTWTKKLTQVWYIVYNTLDLSDADTCWLPPMFPSLFPHIFLEAIPSVTSGLLISPRFNSPIPPTAPQLHISICQSQSTSSTSLWFKKRWEKKRKRRHRRKKIIGRKMKWLSGPSRKSMARSSRQAIFPQLLLLTEPSCQRMKF